MPLEPALNNMPGLPPQLAGMKHLAQLLAAEGRLNELDGRLSEAARSYTDAIRLGNQMSRGGLLITRLVGTACEGIGCRALAKLAPKLSPEQDRVAITDLAKIDDDRVTWAEVLQAESKCTRHELSSHLNPVLWVVAWKTTRQALERAETKHKSMIAHERLLMAELGLRCYRAQTKAAPARLDDLVPGYLTKVLQDPFSKGALIYRDQAQTNWLLYSVGPDGIDDGGRPAERNYPVKGDILVDSAW
jgi:hypothetical protein